MCMDFQFLSFVSQEVCASVQTLETRPRVCNFHMESAAASPTTLFLDTSYHSLVSISLQAVAIIPVRKECSTSDTLEDLRRFHTC